jgi:hypothetical protein
MRKKGQRARSRQAEERMLDHCNGDPVFGFHNISYSAFQVGQILLVSVMPGAEESVDVPKVADALAVKAVPIHPLTYPP